MIPPAFGWSSGDIAIAIEILSHVLKAFNRAKGAKKQYALSCGFLRQLVPVIKRIQTQIADAKNEELRNDLAEQCVAINAAYDDFDAFLHKRYNGLSAQNAYKAKEILQTIRWSLDELHEKVHKFRDRVNDALQPYKALMLQEVCNRVSSLELELANGSTAHGQRISEIQAAMGDVTEQVRLHEELAKDHHQFQASLFEGLKQQQTQGTAAIRGDLAEMRAEMQANHQDLLHSSELERVSSEETHLQLLQCRKDIVGIIGKQQRQAQDQAEIAEWVQLQAQAKQDAESSERAQKLIEGNIQATGKAFTLLGNATKDKRFNKVAKKVEGSGAIFGVCCSFGGIFGSRSEANGHPIPNPASPRTNTSTAPMRDQRKAMAMGFSPRTLETARLLASPPPASPPRRSLGRTLADPFGLDAFPASRHPFSANTRGLGFDGEVCDADIKPALPKRPSTLSPSPCSSEPARSPPALPPRPPSQPKPPVKSTALRSLSALPQASLALTETTNGIPQLSNLHGGVPPLGYCTVPSGPQATHDSRLQLAERDNELTSFTVKEQIRRFENSATMSTKMQAV